MASSSSSAAAADDDNPTLLMTIAQWAWSSDPSPNVTPSTCLSSLPFLRTPCLIRLVAKFIGIAIIASSCINKGECGRKRHTTFADPLFARHHESLTKTLSLSSSKTNHSPSNTQHLQHQIRPRPLPHLHLQRSHNVFQRSPLQFTKRPSLQFLWGNVYGYDTNLDCGDYDLDLWRRRRNQGEKEEECDDGAYGGGLWGVFDLFACGILW